MLGMVDAIVGGMLLGILGIHAEGLIGTRIVAAIGAVFLIGLAQADEGLSVNLATAALGFAPGRLPTVRS